MNIIKKAFLLLRSFLLRKRTVYVFLILLALGLIGLITSRTLTVIIPLPMTSRENPLKNIFPGDLYDVLSFAALIMVMMSFASYIMARRQSRRIASSNVPQTPVSNQPILAVLPSSKETSNLLKNSKEHPQILEVCLALEQ